MLRRLFCRRRPVTVHIELHSGWQLDERELAARVQREIDRASRRGRTLRF